VLTRHFLAISTTIIGENEGLNATEELSAFCRERVFPKGVLTDQCWWEGVTIKQTSEARTATKMNNGRQVHRFALTSLLLMDNKLERLSCVRCLARSNVEISRSHLGESWAMKKLSQILFAVIMVTHVSSLRAQLVGVEYDTGRFYAISTIDGSLQLIDDTGIAGIGSLEFNPQDGTAYGFTTGEAATPTLYRFTISPTLDDVTAELIGPLGISTFEGGIAFSPSGTAYAVNGGVTVPALLSLNLSTGAASVVGSFADRHDFAGLGWRSDGLLIGLDSTDNALLTIDPVTVAVTTIGPVGDTVGTVGGMALGETGGFFVTAGPGAIRPGSNSLYSFDPFTGAQFLIADYGNQFVGRGLSGLTFVPEPATLTLLCIGGMALLRRRSGSKGKSSRLTQFGNR
jgi:hypothetical protein